MSAKKQSGNKKPAPAVKPPVKEKKIQEAGPSFFDRPGKKAFYLFAGILAFIGVIVFLDYLLFHRVYLFKDIASDGINGIYPSMVGAADYLKKYGNISWSFNFGMGQDPTQMVFIDPFNFFLFLFPSDKIAYLLGWKEFLKIFAAGLIFFAYLRTLGKGTFAATIGALMFAFCGYMIIGGQWFVFSFDALNTALVLLGFELLYRKNMPWLFPIPVCLLGIGNPVNLALVSIFLLIYTIFRYLQDNKEGVKDLLVLFLKMAALGLLGIIISAPILVENLKAMLESARVSGPNSNFKALSSAPLFSLAEPLQIGSSVARFFSSDMLGTADAYKGLGNYLEGPLFYCGIPCLLLTPLLFGYLDKREKKLFGALLAIWIIPIFFPFFRRAFWFFTGDYYRTFSFYVALIFLFFSVTCLDRLDKQKRVNIILLASIAVGLILIQLFPYFDTNNTLNASLASASKIYVLAYAAILFWMSIQKNDIPKFVFLALLVSELAWFSSISADRNTSVKTTEWKSKAGYNDYTNDAVAYIKSKDNSFYRIDKFYGSSPAEFKSMDDAMAQDYYSTSCYNSFNQKYYLRYMWANGVISTTNESDSRWCVGLINRPILQCLNSDKYILAKEAAYNSHDPIHDSIARFGDVTVFRNKFPLPLGYCYDSYIRYSNFEKFSLTQKDFTSCRAAVINDTDAAQVKDLKEIRLQDSLLPASFSQGQLAAYLFELKKDTLNITSFNPAHIKGNIDLKSEKIMYLSIPYDIGWHIKVDGTAQNAILIGNGMIGILLKPGKHEVTLDYEQPYRKEGNWLALGGLLLYVGMVFAGFKMKGRKTSDKNES